MKRSNERSMKWSTLLSAVALLAATSLPATADRGSIEIELTDDRISTTVDAALISDEGVSAQRIDVTTTEGIVTLTGSVDNLLAKERAVDLASKIKGVRSVIDQIDVLSPQRPDANVRADVEAALAIDPATDSWEIDVAVVGGTVTLTGTVDSWAERDLSATVAKSVNGVRRVRNEITVEADWNRTDLEIAAEIEKRLEYDVWVDDSLVDVEVESGEVRLSGTVGSVAEKGRARGLGWVAGVKDVDASDLEVKWWADSSTHRDSPYSRPSDAELEAAVRDALLYDPRVASYRPAIQVEGGVVTLRGTVHDYQAKRAAEADAENTFGVLRVKNLLKVRPEPIIADATLRERIEDSLERSPLVDADLVTVSVFNGSVWLYGNASTHFERSIAEEVAGNVGGVVEVSNQIDVSDHWSLLNDLEIQNDIEDQMWWSPYVDAEEVGVLVVDGIATLTGTVDSPRERRAAVKNAFDAGAVAVRSKLQVEGIDGSWSAYHRHPPHVVPIL